MAPTTSTAHPSSTEVPNNTRIAATVPTLDDAAASKVVSLLQERLVCLLDLQLTLKHIHWNVVGMNFIAIHEMLDPQVDVVRTMSDQVAERISTIGGEPLGTPGAITAMRSWDDYELNRAPAVRHLAALDEVYSGVLTDHRRTMEQLGEIDRVSEDLFIGHIAQLELFQWFVRAHLKDSDGDVIHRSAGSKTDRTGAAGDVRVAATNGGREVGR
ncbi:MAG: Dps family protein [Acidimicrobiia bacterium]